MNVMNVSTGLVRLNSQAQKPLKEPAGTSDLRFSGTDRPTGGAGTVVRR